LDELFGEAIMKAKALRLPDDLLGAVKFAEKREKLDEPTTIRKLLRLGAEKYVADSYSRGDITLREAAKVLDIPARNVLELLLDMGITGNLDAADTLKALSFLQKTLPIA
jgi:predicted HTH domain antitoxin